MKETYRQMRKRHQSEFNKFPCFFAFSMKQFNKGMEELGVKDESELYQGIGGMFYRRTDAMNSASPKTGNRPLTH